MDYGEIIMINLGMVQFGSIELTDDCPSGVESVAACGYHSLFVKSDGSLWALDVAHGELGLGDKTNVLHPILPYGVKQVISGVYHSLFIKSDGSLGEWG